MSGACDGMRPAARARPAGCRRASGCGSLTVMVSRARAKFVCEASDRQPDDWDGNWLPVTLRPAPRTPPAAAAGRCAAAWFRPARRPPAPGRDPASPR